MNDFNDELLSEEELNSSSFDEIQENEFNENDYITVPEELTTEELTTEELTTEEVTTEELTTEELTTEELTEELTTEEMTTEELTTEELITEELTTEDSASSALDDDVIPNYITSEQFELLLEDMEDIKALLEYSAMTTYSLERSVSIDNPLNYYSVTDYVLNNNVSSGSIYFDDGLLYLDGDFSNSYSYSLVLPMVELDNGIYYMYADVLSGSINFDLFFSWSFDSNTSTTYSGSLINGFSFNVSPGCYSRNRFYFSGKPSNYVADNCVIRIMLSKEKKMPYRAYSAHEIEQWENGTHELQLQATQGIELNTYQANILDSLNILCYGVLLILVTILIIVFRRKHT